MKKKIQCHLCKGSGKVVDLIPTLDKNKGRVMTNNNLNVMKDCYQCNGTGIVFQGSFLYRHPDSKMR